MEVGGRGLLLARLRTGQVAAADPLCPHEKARLAEGSICGQAVDCPRHHYLFDLATGRNLYPYPIYPKWKREEIGDLTLATYPCREEEDWILVDLGSAAR